VTTTLSSECPLTYDLKNTADDSDYAGTELEITASGDVSVSEDALANVDVYV
jgi:hypothetical protein